MPIPNDPAAPQTAMPAMATTPAPAPAVAPQSAMQAAFPAGGAPNMAAQALQGAAQPAKVDPWLALLRGPRL